MKEFVMPIAFLEHCAFDSDTTRLLGSAFETAWQRFNTSGSPFADEAHVNLARELLAKHIIEMARRGERNEDRLVEGALGHLADHLAKSSATSAIASARK